MEESPVFPAMKYARDGKVHYCGSAGRPGKGARREHGECNVLPALAHEPAGLPRLPP